MDNIINTNNLKKIEDFEGRYSSILNNTVKSVVKKVSTEGNKWVIDPVKTIDNSYCGDTQNCAQTSITDVFVDDDD